MQSSSDHPSQPLSWATIASQSPKKMGLAPTSETSSGIHPLSKCASNESNKKPLKSNHAIEIDPEKAEEKRKKKRKKKKAKVNSSVPESSPTESITLQEPPKIEDDEEFPNLAVSTGERASSFNFARSFTSSQHFTLSSEAWVKPNLFPTSEKNVQSDTSSSRKIELSRKIARPQSVPEALDRKKTQDSQKPKSGGKKSKVPVQLDFGDMLAALEKRQNSDKSKPSSKPLVLSVGSAIPIHSKESRPLVKHSQLNQGKTPHNPLDSSAPLVKKGKQREVPKAKKPSSLKKIILKEREQRKQSRLLEGQEVTLLDKESNPEEQYHATEDKVTEQNNLDPPQSEEWQEDLAVYQEGELQDSSQATEDATADLTPSTSVSPRIPKVHSRRFREYCNQVLRKEVDSCVTELLKELVRFQDRLFQKDPVKAKVKRRLVMGLREVLKHLKLKKLKCVIISPNCEKIQSKGGLDETLQTIIACACEQNIPFVFALNRKALGRCVNKAVPVSVVGIFSYDGAQDHFHKMCELTMQARQDYKDMISALEKEQFENDEVPERQTELLASQGEHDLSEVWPVSLPEKLGDDDEPEYIKIWKRMLDNDYNPYSVYLDDTPASEMLNLHL